LELRVKKFDMEKNKALKLANGLKQNSASSFGPQAGQRSRQAIAGTCRQARGRNDGSVDGVVGQGRTGTQGGGLSASAEFAQMTSGGLKAAL